MFGHEHPDHQLLLIRQHHADLLRAAESSRSGRRRLHGERRGFHLPRGFRIIRQRRPRLIARRI